MAEDKKEDDKSEELIVIKKINKGGGHHGGAWKVAYADFVTAMMAFFLLLWLLNVTTDEEKNAISNYFDPTHPKVSDSSSGAGGLLGGLSMSPDGAMASNLQPITTPPPTTTGSKMVPPEKTKIEKAVEKAKEIMRKKEEKEFKTAEQKIKQAIQNSPELAALAKNLMVDMTPEGLRIQIIDQEGESMFASGSAHMYQKTKNLMGKLAEIIKTLPNEISVRGHTDSSTYPPEATYTNWELSADRANASRRVLLESGIPMERLNNVVGKADTEHLIPDRPKDPQNRRISIILLKEELTNPDFNKEAEDAAPQYLEEENDDILDEINDEAHGEESGLPQLPPINTFRRTPGNIEFP